MNRYCLLLLFALWAMASPPSIAQEFMGRAEVGPVPQAGYYRVVLPPHVIGQLQPQGQDLRLFRPDGPEVPYLLLTDIPTSFARLPVQTFTRPDSAKKTILHVNFGQTVYPEEVRFYVSGPDLYHRQVTIWLGSQKQVRTRKLNRRRRRSSLQEKAVRAVLQSKSANQVHLPRQKTEKLLVEIDNADNPPLALDSLIVLQQTQYLVARLEAGTTYTLKFGNATLTAPVYDLAFFQDSLPKNLPEAPLHHIKIAPAPQIKSPAPSRMLIWASIAVVTLALGWMTRQLLVDMDKKKE